MTLELFKTPKKFVETCLKHLKDTGHGGEYDYNRFILEETNELILNHYEGNHISNTSLLVDDIVDSLWVILAKIDYIPTVVYEQKYPMNLQVEMLSYCQHKYINSKDSHWLQEMVKILLTIASINNIDVNKNFKALCDENMSKLPPEGSSKEFIAEIYRDGKCQKKDLNGNFYPHYKPATFLAN